MSAGLMCDCPLPPMHGLRDDDAGHSTRSSGKPGCPNYAEDQERGGRCRFCADAALLRIEDGPVVIKQTKTDPGDMGEPRVFESEGVTYVTVPDFDLWGLDVERLKVALAAVVSSPASLRRLKPSPVARIERERQAVDAALDALRSIEDPDEHTFCVDCGVEVADGLPICWECDDDDRA